MGYLRERKYVAASEVSDLKKRLKRKSWKPSRTELKKEPYLTQTAIFNIRIYLKDILLTRSLSKELAGSVNKGRKRVISRKKTQKWMTTNDYMVVSRLEMIEWIQNFIRNYSNGMYFPHIQIKDIIEILIVTIIVYEIMLFRSRTQKPGCFCEEC